MFPKDALNIGFFKSLLEIHAAAGNSAKDPFRSPKNLKRYDYTIP